MKQKRKENTNTIVFTFALGLIVVGSVIYQHISSPEEIADTAVFLCSNRARFITGATLVVDGGQTVGLM